MKNGLHGSMFHSCCVVLSLSMLLLTLFIVEVSGAMVSWTNTAGGSWSVPANWSSGAVPAQDDDVSITTEGNHTFTLNVNASMAGLRVSDLKLATVAADDPTNISLSIGFEEAALVSWPAEFVGWSLCPNTSLNSGGWQHVSGASHRFVDTNVVPEKFYRLRKP